MPFAAAYLGIVVTMVTIDFLMLTRVIKPYYERTVPDLLVEDPRLSAAVIFYLGYGAGLLWFAVQPALAMEATRAALLQAALNGAILGMVAYGTYELTNMATLKGWTWGMVIADFAWGTVLSAGVAVIGTLIARMLTN